MLTKRHLSFAILFCLSAFLWQGTVLAYEKIAENDHLVLFLKEETLAIRIQDKATGYVWSSVIEDLIPKENNVSWSNFMSSGLAIEYFDGSRTRLIRTDLLGAKEVRIKIQLQGHGFIAHVNFGELGLYLEVHVFLDENQVVVRVPNQAIVEDGNSRLATVYLFPFLGATRKGDTPGYLFVPDGVGALIQFVDNQNKFATNYEERFFGRNEGLNAASSFQAVRSPYTMKAPVFGLFHDSLDFGPHGIFGVIEAGQYNAKLAAYPNGVITQYNWVTPKFLLRETYSQPTSRNLGSGVLVYEKHANPEDLQIRYFFHSGADAGYVGMARVYQNYLEKHGVLRRSPNLREKIPLRLDLLGAETENGLFRKKLVVMTGVERALAMVADLQDAIDAEFLVVFQGWNEGGLSGVSPYTIRFEKELGGFAGFNNLIQQLEEDQVRVYFYTDYTTAYKNSARFTIRRDGARRINKTTLEKRLFAEVYDNAYYLTPQVARELIREDLRHYASQGIGRVAVDQTASILFSHLRHDEVTSRLASARYYQEGLAELRASLNGLILYQPNSYLWGVTDAFLDLPLYSSQYGFFRSVPFLPIVFKGYLDYFAPYSNFFANQREELLRLVEYGAFPSYYLTDQPSYKLKHTNSSQIFTSTFEDWRDAIIADYQMLNTVLGSVEGATICGHEQLAEGVMAVEYSNGQRIVVNYNRADYQYGAFVIPGLSAAVEEVRGFEEANDAAD